MSFTIHGLGTAQPPDAVGPDEGLAIARRLAGPDVRMSSWLGPIYAGSGVERRFQVIGGLAMRDALEGTCHTNSPFLPSDVNEGVGPTTAVRMERYAAEAGPLALQATGRALQQSGIAADAITHLVTVSCTGFAAPGIDRALVSGFGLRPTVQRTNVGFMGCHGALNGLRVAHAFAVADPSACVLLCAVELCSLHYYYGSAPDKLVANAIFADGAAAVIGTGPGRRPTHHPDRETSTSSRPWSLVASGSCIIPDSIDDMSWTVGDHGFVMSLSRRVPALIAVHLRPWLEQWLGGHGLGLSDIGSWAVHPGGPKIINAVQESLMLPHEALAASRGVLADYGNMSSPTVLFVLQRLRDQSAQRPCVALGFGPGLVAEAALLD